MHYRVLLALLLWLPGLLWAGQCSLLIMGDSLSSGHGLAPKQGWVDKLEARLAKQAPAWRVVNASVSGDTTQNGVQRLPAALQRQRPQGVLIALGGNDALRGVPPAEIRQNLLSMITQARQAGAWVLLFEPPVLPNYGKAYAEAVARQYRELAREQRVTLVPCFICEVGVDPALMQADGIHPNERAQDRMLAAVWPSLKPRLACPARNGQ
jgi:acyl-CoA thioesterase-1